MIVRDGEKYTSYERRVICLRRSNHQIVSGHSGTNDWKTDKFIVGQRQGILQYRVRSIPGEK